jgi:hypothetical protein
MELNWSRWFRCESSFGLLLVPHQPGIFALAEEMVQPAGGSSRRLLAVFEIDESEDVARALSRLFLPSSPWRSRLADSRCYLRYAVVADDKERQTSAATLRKWLTSQMDAAAQIFEQPRTGAAEAAGEIRSERRMARAEREGEAAERCGVPEVHEMRGERLLGQKTVAERAVDKVMAMSS